MNLHIKIIIGINNHNKSGYATNIYFRKVILYINNNIDNITINSINKYINDLENILVSSLIKFFVSNGTIKNNIIQFILICMLFIYQKVTNNHKNITVKTVYII